MPTLDELYATIKDVHERVTAMAEPLGEEAIKPIVEGIIKQRLEDENSEFYRKMRFGRAETPLVGTKFSRWGLSIADIEWLYDVTSMARLVGRGSGPSEELSNTFKAVSDAYYLSQEEVRRIDGKAIDDLFPRVAKSWLPQVRAALDIDFRRDWIAHQAAMKAMDSAESGYGSQLIGAQYVGELWEAARRDSRVFALLNTFEMTDPTAYLPVEADLPEMLFVSENTASDSSEYTTTKSGSQRVTVTAKKFVIHQIWSGELEEDSIIPFVPFLRRQAALSVAHYSDSLVLNGDDTNAGTGNINLDDADPADTKHYLAFDGIRHVGLVDNTANQQDMGGALTYSELLKGPRGRMIDSTALFDWGHPTDPADLVYVADPESTDAIADLDEVITVDKFGAQATVLTGQQAKIGQHPLISSIAMLKTEADGKVSTTAGNNTKGQVVTFNRRGFVPGWRRRVKVEVERLPARDQNRIVYSLRLGFGRYSRTGAAAAIEAADVIFDITL